MAFIMVAVLHCFGSGVRILPQKLTSSQLAALEELRRVFVLFLDICRVVLRACVQLSLLGFFRPVLRMKLFY